MLVTVVLGAMLDPVTVVPIASVAACAGVRVSVVAPKAIVDPPKVTFWFVKKPKLTAWGNRTYFVIFIGSALMGVKVIFFF